MVHGQLGPTIQELSLMSLLPQPSSVVNHQTLLTSSYLPIFTCIVASQVWTIIFPAFHSIYLILKLNICVVTLSLKKKQSK